MRAVIFEYDVKNPDIRASKSVAIFDDNGWVHQADNVTKRNIERGDIFTTIEVAGIEFHYPDNVWEEDPESCIAFETQDNDARIIADVEIDNIENCIKRRGHNDKSMGWFFNLTNGGK